MQLFTRLGCRKYRRQLYRKQNGECYWCKKKLPLQTDNNSDKVTVDHLTPLWRGGNNTIDNLVVACLPCNSYRNSQDQATDDRKYEYWLEYRNFYNRVA